MIKIISLPYLHHFHFLLKYLALLHKNKQRFGIGHVNIYFPYKSFSGRSDFKEGVAHLRDYLFSILCSHQPFRANVLDRL